MYDSFTSIVWASLNKPLCSNHILDVSRKVSKFGSTKTWHQVLRQHQTVHHFIVKGTLYPLRSWDSELLSSSDFIDAKLIVKATFGC
jgi:hypothetical protein